MLPWLPVGSKPEENWKSAEDSSGEERDLPSKTTYDPGDDQRRESCSQVSAGIEDAGCQRAFLLGEPLCYGLDSRRKIAGFSDPEGETRSSKPQRCPGQRMRSSGKAPNANGQRVTGACADPVHQAS